MFALSYLWSLDHFFSLSLAPFQSDLLKSEKKKNSRDKNEDGTEEAEDREAKKKKEEYQEGERLSIARTNFLE